MKQGFEGWAFHSVSLLRWEDKAKKRDHLSLCAPSVKGYMICFSLRFYSRPCTRIECRQSGSDNISKEKIPSSLRWLPPFILGALSHFHCNCSLCSLLLPQKDKDSCPVYFTPNLEVFITGEKEYSGCDDSFILLLEDMAVYTMIFYFLRSFILKFYGKKSYSFPFFAAANDYVLTWGVCVLLLLFSKFNIRQGEVWFRPWLDCPSDGEQLLKLTKIYKIAVWKSWKKIKAGL